jgi:hypothetical protein
MPSKERERNINIRRGWRKREECGGEEMYGSLRNGPDVCHVIMMNVVLARVCYTSSDIDSRQYL